VEDFCRVKPFHNQRSNFHAKLLEIPSLTLTYNTYRDDPLGPDHKIRIVDPTPIQEGRAPQSELISMRIFALQRIVEVLRNLARLAVIF